MKLVPFTLHVPLLWHVFGGQGLAVGLTGLVTEKKRNIQECIHHTSFNDSPNHLSTVKSCEISFDGH